MRHVLFKPIIPGVKALSYGVIALYAKMGDSQIIFDTGLALISEFL